MTNIISTSTEQKFGLYGYLDMHKAIRRHIASIVESAKLANASDNSLLKYIQNRFNFYWDLVEHHHLTEDNGFFPMLAGMDAIFAGQLGQLTADHHAIDEVVVSIKTNMGAAIQGDETGTRNGYFERAANDLATFQSLMLEHLDREEAAVIPGVCRHFTYEQQIAMEQQLVEGFELEFVAKVSPWTMEILTTEERAEYLQAMPEKFKAVYVEWEKAYYRNF